MQNSTTRKAKQNIFANLDNHWRKKCSFFCVQTNWVCPSGTQRNCKNDSDSSLELLTVTRVESFCEKRGSSRVTISLNVTRVRVTKNRDYSRAIDSSQAITVTCTIKTNKTKVRSEQRTPGTAGIVTFHLAIFTVVQTSWTQSYMWQRWADCEIFQSESRSDSIKLNPNQPLSAKFLKIISPIQSWSVHVK